MKNLISALVIILVGIGFFYTGWQNLGEVAWVAVIKDFIESRLAIKI